MLTTRAVLVLVLLSSLLIAPSFSVATPIVFSDFGIDAASILDTVDAFRGAIGGANNGVAPGSFATGRREIGWDGGGAAAPVLVDMPKDLFQNRGAQFSPGTHDILHQRRTPSALRQHQSQLSEHLHDLQCPKAVRTDQ